MAHECKDHNEKSQLLHEGDIIAVREPWQGKDNEEANAAVVLRCVFALLPARELWLCGSVNRTWRRVADDNALWRRLLVPNASPQTLRVLAATANIDTLNNNEEILQCRWRKEYYLSRVQWRQHLQLTAPGTHSAPLQCAALHPSASYLAIIDEDAQLFVWENTRYSAPENLQKNSEWSLRWSGSISASWCSAAFVQWAPRSRRLLLIGCVALTDRSELLVLDFNVNWHQTTLCRSACGPGGGFWVNDDMFLTLQLRLLAPALAFTTVWLTAASQETHSEHIGVTTPLLRIFNEAATHVSHFLIVETPNCEKASIESELTKGTYQINCAPTASYYRALRPKRDNKEKTTRLLIAACGAVGGDRGKAQAVASWALPDVLMLPRVRVCDALADRVQLRRERALRPAINDEAPEEQAVRALCTTPGSVCNLFAQICGFVLHPRGGCVWVSTASGAACVSVRGLHPLLQIPRQSPLKVPLMPPHYLWATVDDDYFATPAGYGSPNVDMLTVRSARHAASLQHDAPALVAMLLPRYGNFPCKTRTLLVLTSKALNIIRNMSEVKQSDGLGDTCKVPEPPTCPPCQPTPRPACRPPEPALGPWGLRRVCCAPSAGQRPPCTPTPIACPKTCKHAKEQKKNHHCGTSKCRSEHEKCGDNLDRVARRLASAELTRRLNYEREVADEKKMPICDPIAYNLANELECMRATDGHDYTASKQSTTQSRCGPCRRPPPPCPVHLEPTDNCKINRSQHLDPCAHRPRIFLEIDRSQNLSSTEKSIVSPLNSEKEGISADPTSSSRPSPAESLTTRIIETFRSSKASCPRRPCKKTCTNQNAQYAGDTSWCANIPQPSPVPANCKEPSLTERLRRRSGSLCSKPCGSRHRIHTKTCVGKTSEIKYSIETLQNEKNNNKLESILNERSQLKEAGLGRVVITQKQTKETNPLSGGLMELQIPPTSDSVCVRVSLNFENDKSAVCTGPSTSHLPISQNLSSCTNDSSGSWLSIKNLQKKFTGCRKHESQQTSEKPTALGPCRPKPECNKETSKLPNTPTGFGEACPRGEASKSSFPLTHRSPQSICKENSRRDPPKCSFKKDILNTVI